MVIFYWKYAIMMGQMKNTIIPLLLIGMLLSVSFGVLMMNHMDGQGHNLCPFEAVTNCAQGQNSINFMTSHLSALAKFFSSTSVNSLVNLISIFTLLDLAISPILKSESLKLRPLLIKNKLRESFVPPQRTLFTDWFSLHENSPAFLVRR